MVDDSNSGDSGALRVQILGQELFVKDSVRGVFSLLLILCTVLTILYFAISLYQTSPDARQFVASQFTVSTTDTTGAIVQKPDQLIYRFWTPSIETADAYLKGKDPSATVPIYYETDSTKLIQFGESLTRKLGKGLGAQGFSRFEVIGRGTSSLKPGWMWEVTFDRNLITEKLFINFYSSFWQRTENIYLQILGAQETYHSQSKKSNEK